MHLHADSVFRLFHFACVFWWHRAGCEQEGDWQVMGGTAARSSPTRARHSAPCFPGVPRRCSSQPVAGFSSAPVLISLRWLWWRRGPDYCDGGNQEHSDSHTSAPASHIRVVRRLGIKSSRLLLRWTTGRRFMLLFFIVVAFIPI